MNQAIRTDGLVKKFRGVKALRDLNLVVPEGAVYALVGPTVPARRPRSKFS